VVILTPSKSFFYYGFGGPNVKAKMVFECLKGILWHLWVRTLIIKHYSILTWRSCLQVLWWRYALRGLKRGRKWPYEKPICRAFFNPWTPIYPQFIECNALGLVVSLHFFFFFHYFGVHISCLFKQIDTFVNSIKTPFVSILFFQCKSKKTNMSWT
jgi:hypothetical protein